MRIAVHKCGEEAPVVRDMTPQEEAEVLALRAAENARPPRPKTELELLRERVDRLENLPGAASR